MITSAYLYRWVSVLDVVLQVTHQHQVTCLVPAWVQSMVIYVAEDSTGTDTVGAILGVDELAEAVHDHSAVLSLALLLVLLGLHNRKTLQHTILHLMHNILWNIIKIASWCRCLSRKESSDSAQCRFSPWSLPAGPGCVCELCSQTCSRCAWFCAGRHGKFLLWSLCSPGRWAAGQRCHKPCPRLWDCQRILKENLKKREERISKIHPYEQQIQQYKFQGWCKSHILDCNPLIHIYSPNTFNLTAVNNRQSGFGTTHPESGDQCSAWSL